jgi:hypothetical protein
MATTAMTVHEFIGLDKNNEPVFPPIASTPVGSSTPVALKTSTQYVIFTTTVAAWGICTTSSTVATGAGFQLEAGKNFGFSVRQRLSASETLYCDIEPAS